MEERNVVSRKGKTYEEIYGVEKAKKIKEKISIWQKENKEAFKKKMKKVMKKFLYKYLIFCENCGLVFESIIINRKFCSRSCQVQYQHKLGIHKERLKKMYKKFRNEGFYRKIGKKSKKPSGKNHFLYGKTWNEVYGKKRADEIRLRVIEGTAKGRRKHFGRYHVTKPQLTLYKKILNVCPNAILEFPVGKKIVDIAIPLRKIAFEYDGAYWHQDKEADRKRDEYLSSLGWKVCHITKDELQKFNINKVIQILKLSEQNKIAVKIKMGV